MQTVKDVLYVAEKFKVTKSQALKILNYKDNEFCTDCNKRSKVAYYGSDGVVFSCLFCY